VIDMLIYPKEEISKSVGFVFFLNGFTKTAIQFMKNHAIAWSQDEQWFTQ